MIPTRRLVRRCRVAAPIRGANTGAACSAITGSPALASQPHVGVIAACGRTAAVATTLRGPTRHRPQRGSPIGCTRSTGGAEARGVPAAAARGLYCAQSPVQCRRGVRTLLNWARVRRPSLPAMPIALWRPTTTAADPPLAYNSNNTPHTRTTPARVHSPSHQQRVELLRE